MFGRKQGRGKFSMFTFTYRHKLPFDLAKLGQQITENVYFVGIYTVFWNDILQRANATNKGLQDPKLSLNTAVASLVSLKDFISSKRDSFEDYERQGKELSGSAEYAQAKIRKRTRNVRLNPLDYGREEEVQLTPSQSFRIGEIVK